MEKFRNVGLAVVFIGLAETVSGVVSAIVVALAALAAAFVGLICTVMVMLLYVIEAHFRH